MRSFKLCLLKTCCIYGAVLSYSIFADPPVVPISTSNKSIVSVVNKSGSIGTGFFISPQVIATALHNIIDDFYNKRVKDNIFFVHPETGEQINVSSIRNIDFKNDIILLNVEDFVSNSFYDLSLLQSSTYSESKKSYVLGMLNGKLVKLNGSTPHPYSKEDPSLQRITYMHPQNMEGLSGSPIFTEDGKIIGIVNSYERGVNVGFTQIQAVQRILNQSSTSYDTIYKAIENRIDYFDKVVQFRFGWYELNNISPYTPGMSEQQKQKIRTNQVAIAVHWFRKSAAQGYSPAMLELANIYLNGMGAFEVDIQQFRSFAEQSANKGFAPAQHKLGAFLIHVKDHLDRAVHWLTLATQQGYFGDISPLLLLTTEGVPFSEIIKALDTLSTAGHPQAKAILAYHLLTGDRVHQDVKRGKTLLEQAVADQYPLAMEHLADLYQKGDYGYPQDNNKAEELRRQANQLGYLDEYNRNTGDEMNLRRVSTVIAEACRGFIARSLTLK